MDDVGWSAMRQYRDLAGVAAGRAINVYNKTLSPCSKKNQAITGYDRTGLCASSSNTDGGKHHVCINMDMHPNFCELTGQSNWCDGTGPCVGSPSDVCPRRGWCVCQWAFSSAVEKAGCDALEVDCDATSVLALRAYEDDPARHGAALACLKKKCRI